MLLMVEDRRDREMVTGEGRGDYAASGWGIAYKICQTKVAYFFGTIRLPQPFALHNPYLRSYSQAMPFIAYCTALGQMRRRDGC